MKTAAKSGPRIVLLQTQAENAGAQEIARILGYGLQARGFDVHFAFFFRRTEGYDNAPGVFFGADSRPSGPRAAAQMALRVRRCIAALAPDAVMTFQHFGNVLGAPVARLAGAGPVIANLNTSLKALPYWVRAADWLLSATGVYTRTIANSASTAAEFRAVPPPFANRMLRIDHGFEPKPSELSKEAARLALDLPADAILLGMVGRLDAQKNQRALILLLSDNPTWHVALAGQGKTRGELEAMARDLRCHDRVHFVGELSPTRVGTFLKALDVFVFASLRETFGLAAVEAANNAIPVVCHDLGVLREVLSVEGSPCARFADATDTQALATAVHDVLTDPELAATLTARGRRLSDKYSLDSMVDAYVALLEAIGVRLPSPREVNLETARSLAHSRF